jgi:hypothetical protein
MTNHLSGRWRAVALVAIVLIPPLACGGIVALREDDAGTDARSPTSTATASTSTGTASATASPTTTASSTGSAPSTDGGFGPFPCLAYTVWHESCPPTAGTAGCFYTVPASSADPANGWTNLSGYVAQPGCKLVITLPAANQCESAHCFCGSDDKWDPDPVDAGQWPCPN